MYLKDEYKEKRSGVAHFFIKISNMHKMELINFLLIFSSQMHGYGISEEISF